jgi:type II secretory pathway component PulL
MDMSNFLFWFAIRMLNSWVFRLTTVLFILLLLSTTAYSAIEFYKTVRPGKALEKLSVQLFCYWAVLLQALLFVMGIGYIFPN